MRHASKDRGSGTTDVGRAMGNAQGGARDIEPIDIAPFALPNTPSNELRFEECRDVERIVVLFEGSAPSSVGAAYLGKTWPNIRLEEKDDLSRPAFFGWTPMDDQFNGEWRTAAVSPSPQESVGDSRVVLTFQGLSAELPELEGYDVRFRRTCGIRVECEDVDAIAGIRVYTRSPAAVSDLLVRVHRGNPTPGRLLRFEGYNTVIEAVGSAAGGRASAEAVELGKAGERDFLLTVRHMLPWHRYCGDHGHVRFLLDDDFFTISLTDLLADGPIWFEELGVYVTLKERDVPFEDYRRSCSGAGTIAQRVKERPEQSYAGAVSGQPRAHPVAYSVGCKHARQRFWMDPNGDILLSRDNVVRVPGRDTPRFANSGTGRFFFGLETWRCLARYPDPAPALAYNMVYRRNAVELSYRCLAAPLERSILEGELAGDDAMVCLVRLAFTNLSDAPASTALNVRYSQSSTRARNHYIVSRSGAAAEEWYVPRSAKESLLMDGALVFGEWQGRRALRCRIETDMRASCRGEVLRIEGELAPGATRAVLLKIPFINLDRPEELELLKVLDLERCNQEMALFWREDAAEDAQVITPVEQLNSLHAAHHAHVQITDFAMPDDPHLINTSVGTSTYGNFSNESCMIVQELTERGLTEEARRRLELWVTYQGTVPLAGNFTDHDGMFFGAGGFEMGQYNQHHGWVLWALSEHYLFTQDAEWFGGVADAVIAGADWVFRQRRNTMQDLPHSRGWERGFLPAGSLEDVTDFHYWLSTNVLTWRGCESCARALEAAGHSEASRIRAETDAYAEDLRRGFETMRRHAPLVRLRTGRWVPQYTARLYCRGRDLGWIRALLEGPIYLLISGLYDSSGREAGWILDDYQDNLYLRPPYGYVLVDEEAEWFDRGGFSIQPNLLAGLMPYLDRDEPELYIWTFFNAWAACYREEIDAMVEHPLPVLGYSNSAHFKTSDQANALMWLRYMFVYCRDGTLHLGRAIPRAWFHHDEAIGASKVATPYGQVAIAFEADSGSAALRAEAVLELRRDPERILVRFRHPEAVPIAAVEVNGRPWTAFDPAKGDVDITGMNGTVAIEAHYDEP